MRDKQDWLKRARPRFIKKLTPRIQQVINSIEVPELPPVDSYFIYGPSNYGKTIFSILLKLKEEEILYINQEFNKHCVFVKTSDLVAEIKKSFNRDFKDPQSETDWFLVERYAQAHLLILDDFGVDRPSGWVMEALYQIIDKRYENLKKTIITSNLSLGEIAENWGDQRITSRIERMCKIISKEPYDRA